MLQRTNRILIGKDISRDAQVVDGATLATITLSSGLADGEIVVLDKFKKVLAAGATAADSDTIYICQGTADTFSYTTEGGSTITGARKILISDPIQAANVLGYRGKSYVVKAEKTAVVNLTGMTPVVNREYIVRIIYKDIKEHPGQFTQTYRYISTSATLKTLVDAITAKINAHSGRRVVSSDDDSSITLTGLEIPTCCTGLNDLDAFDMVDFEVKFLYVDANGNWQTMDSTTKTVTYTGPTFGSGNWEQIRDIERDAVSYSGPTNKTHWPVILPSYATVVDATYDVIVIEHDKSYLSPDNQYVKKAPLKTILAFVVPTTGDQETNVLARLNTWMASTPGAFEAVSV